MKFERAGDILGITEIGQPFDLAKTLECGQCFRWKRLKDGLYYGIVYGQVIYATQGGQENSLFVKADLDKERILHYFDLYRDYNELYKVINLNSFEKRALEFGKGIRVLNQEPFETLISFIISQRNSIKRITNTIDALCKAYNKEIDRKKFYKFPTAQDIVEGGLDKLSNLKLGYRDIYIYKAAEAIAENSIDLEHLRSAKVSCEEAVHELKKLYGVGDKVANCVALFSLEKTECFPVDIWVQRAIDRYFDGMNPRNKYGSLAGLFQQLIFYTMIGDKLNEKM